MKKQTWPDLALLIFRIQLGVFMLTHGIPKVLNFQERMNTFHDPFGLGSTISLCLVIFAEVFCSLLVILGVRIRLALIPLIITMLVVVFYAHADDPFGRKELPLMFLMSYIVLFLTGPGKYTLGKNL